MAETIEITGLEERIQSFGKIATNNPVMQKRIQEVIRNALAGVRRHLQSQSKAGLQMQSDPRGTYKAIRMSVYKKIFGGNVSILSSRRTHGATTYKPSRKLDQNPKQRGGNRIPRSPKTDRTMSYSGIDREFVMRFLDVGTSDRTTRYGNRGNIPGRDWFGRASKQEVEKAALLLDNMINDIITGVMY